MAKRGSLIKALATVGHWEVVWLISADSSFYYTALAVFRTSRRSQNACTDSLHGFLISVCRHQVPVLQNCIPLADYAVSLITVQHHHHQDEGAIILRARFGIHQAILAHRGDISEGCRWFPLLHIADLSTGTDGELSRTKSIGVNGCLLVRPYFACG